MKVVDQIGDLSDSTIRELQDEGKFPRGWVFKSVNRWAIWVSEVYAHLKADMSPATPNRIARDRPRRQRSHAKKQASAAPG